MMDHLEPKFNFNPPLIQHRMNVFHSYVNRRMADGMSISKHVLEIRAAAYELEIAEVRVPDEMQAVVLMNSLPESWDDVAYLLNLQLGMGVGKENELRFDNVSQRLRVAAEMGPPRRTRGGGNNAGLREYCCLCRRLGHNQSNCREDQHAEQDCKSDNDFPFVQEMNVFEMHYHEIKTSRRLNYTGANFSLWKCGLSAVLGGLGLGYVLKHPKPSEPTDSTLEQDVNSYNKWLADDFTCRHLILGAMEDNLMVTLKNQPTGKALMDELNAWFDFPSLGRRMSLFRQYVECVMSDNTKIDDHISNMKTMVQELKRAGIDVPDEIEAVVLLNSLPRSWEDLIIVITMRIDKETKQGMKLLDSAVRIVRDAGQIRALNERMNLKDNNYQRKSKKGYRGRY